MAENLRKDQIQEYKEAFFYFDRSGKGKINSEKVGMVMRSLGKNPTEAELLDIISDIDKKNKGLVTFQEFLKLMTRKTAGPDSEEDIREAFGVFDSGGNGSISALELRHAMTQLGERLSEEEVNEMIKEGDIEG